MQTIDLSKKDQIVEFWEAQNWNGENFMWPRKYQNHIFYLLNIYKKDFGLQGFQNVLDEWFFLNLWATASRKN